MTEFEVEPIGPFSLAAAQDFAPGFTAGIGGGSVEGSSIVMSFPVEGRNVSAEEELRQDAWRRIVGVSDAEADVLPDVIRQASHSLSLDHDGSGGPGVGERGSGSASGSRCARAPGFEAWRPFRMWAVVLLRVAWNRSAPGGSYRS